MQEVVSSTLKSHRVSGQETIDLSVFAIETFAFKLTFKVIVYLFKQIVSHHLIRL